MFKIYFHVVTGSPGHVLYVNTHVTHTYIHAQIPIYVHTHIHTHTHAAGHRLTVLPDLPSSTFEQHVTRDQTEDKDGICYKSSKRNRTTYARGQRRSARVAVPYFHHRMCVCGVCVCVRGGEGTYRIVSSHTEFSQFGFGV